MRLSVRRPGRKTAVVAATPGVLYVFGSVYYFVKSNVVPLKLRLLHAAIWPETLRGTLVRFCRERSAQQSAAQVAALRQSDAVTTI